jgi:outer membrane protein assembly factor BamA
VPGIHGAFDLGYSGIETLHFYGFGNDTEETESREFYKLRRGRLLVRPSLTASLTQQLELDVALRFEVSDTDTVPDEPNLVSQLRPYGVGRFLQAGAEIAVQLDMRDRPAAATRGFLVEGAAQFFPTLLDVDQGRFGKISGGASVFVPFSRSGDPTLALGVAGEKLWGNYPFYEAAFLGGPGTLRGFRTERFAGDAALYGRAEFRVLLGHIGLLVPWDVGVFAFTDAGRVYVAGVSPGGWHISAGGALRASHCTSAVALGSEPLLATYCFNCSRYCRRSLATLGAMTAWQ